MELTVRELKIGEANLIVNYFLNSEEEYLVSLGVDVQKLPNAKYWEKLIEDDLLNPLEKRKFYYLLWLVDGTPIGHSHIANIIYGKEAYMHLHLWKPLNRKNGQGSFFIKESIAKYFDMFNLKELCCEPYSENSAPNKTLSKVGFEFIKSYETIPSWLNFKQIVNKWVLTKEQYISLDWAKI
ncbi:GNAT family N-acetyltransferase [Gammaproteobacteria bacterium]|nr:GNAT family N-acetyltransferase [Gammaproteobacteria bacterium]